MENTLVEKITSNFDIKTITVNEKIIINKKYSDTLFIICEKQFKNMKLLNSNGIHYCRNWSKSF